MKLETVRNIGISAHIDSGKTTLTERILYYAGRIHKIEEVRGAGDGATMDHMELEKERGITITSAATQVEWDKHKINIIDTPGHVDFTVEVERSLRVLDGAILVLCSVGGVQSQSITVDRQMKRYGVPRLAFVNKMDRTGADPFTTTKQLREKLKLNAVMVQLPIGTGEEFTGVIDLVSMKAYYNEGEKGERVRVEEIPAGYEEKAEEKRHEMLDALTMFNDDLMEKMLEEEEIPESLIHRAIHDGVQSLQLCPVFMGSAFKNKSVQALLDAVNRYLPSPLEAVNTRATTVKTGEPVELVPDPKLPLVALAFKITDDQFGQLTYTRIYRGTLQKGESIVNARTGKKLRVGRLVRMHSDSRENIESATAGDIVAMIGVDCASGDTFCSEGSELVSCESMHIADPVISLALKAKDNDSTTKMGKALQRFMKEDPTFKVRTDEESGETIISGMGELHLEVYIERMKREYKADVVVGAPQVNYRECINGTTSYDYTHKKQTGGSGQFARVAGNVAPLSVETEEDFEFVNNIRGGVIPQEFIPACEKGFRDVMEEGPLAGFPMVKVQVSLEDGKTHDVDSSEMAFRIACRAALKEAIRKANPGLLEPVMHVEVETPTEFQGTVIGDLSSRRGVVAGTEVREDVTVINAQVPLREMFGYSTDLRSSTQGKAGYSMEFHAYQAMPKNIENDVIKERAERKAQKG
ncbi:MAG: elongation factor G [Myxococcota bacterium]